jgi:hypothetical protein
MYKVENGFEKTTKEMQIVRIFLQEVTQIATTPWRNGDAVRRPRSGPVTRHCEQLRR